MTVLMASKLRSSSSTTRTRARPAVACGIVLGRRSAPPASTRGTSTRWPAASWPFAPSARRLRRAATDPHAQRQQQIDVDRLGDIVDAPASRHFWRSPFIALAVTAINGTSAIGALRGPAASSRSRPSPAS